jgi:type IV pilus assembly protein PilN
MIKINLLLTRKEKKKVGIRREFIVLIASVTLLFVSFFVVQSQLDKAKEEKLAQISKTRKEIDDQKARIKDINQAKALQKNFQERLSVIDSLRKGKSISAKLLDEISTAKPDKVHLESLRKDGTKIGIEGFALDDETVANLMTNLRKSKVFKNIELIVSEQMEQNKIRLKKFVLSCEIS